MSSLMKVPLHTSARVNGERDDGGHGSKRKTSDVQEDMGPNEKQVMRMRKRCMAAIGRPSQQESDLVER
jgi:hypothetical protein